LLDWSPIRFIPEINLYEIIFHLAEREEEKAGLHCDPGDKAPAIKIAFCNILTCRTGTGR
jgi:hypothetical protein